MLQMKSRYPMLASALVIAMGCGERLGASTLCLRVSDYGDMPLQGAWVNIVNLQSNKLYTERTDPDGRACITQIPEGLYSVETGLTGFLNVRYYPVRVKYPAVQQLQFRLPFGEINEGPLVQEASIAGTLKQGDTPTKGVTICIFQVERDTPLTCATTTNLGEYAFSLPPGMYIAEVRLPGGETQRSKIDVTTAGSYTNLITVMPVTAQQPTPTEVPRH